jgi:DNA repair exonuclease SbcCD ATPase subunit
MRSRGFEEGNMLRQLSTTAALVLFVITGVSTALAADSDTRAAREREMLRRAQEALRQSEEQNNELGHAKADAEQKLKDAAAQLDSARKTSRSALSALQSKLQAAAAAQTDLTEQLERAKQQIAQLTSQQQDTAKRLGAREAELNQTQQDLQLSKTENASCEAKNLKLYEYSDELVSRYQKKGVWAALAQKEPVVGIKEVGVENVVQEYREKLASQKISAPTSSSPTAPKTAN